MQERQLQLLHTDVYCTPIGPAVRVCETTTTQRPRCSDPINTHMRMTLVYLKEYPTHTGELIARILKDLHYTLTGSMTEQGLVWELAVSDCDPYTVTLLETAISEYIVRGSYSVEIDDVDSTNTYTISRLRANSLGIDIG